MPRPPNRPDAVEELPESLDQDSLKGRQLGHHLRAMVEGLAPGALLPSERVLAERLQVARGTVRAQVDALAADGLVRRVPGRGTFVAQKRFVQTQRMSSFTKDMLSRGLRPSSRVLSLRVGPSSQPVADKLEIPVGTMVLRLARIRYADDEPMAVERGNIPIERFPGLERLDLNTRSLYDVFATEYGCRVDAGDQRVSVLLLNATDARLLGTKAGSPAFDIERVTRDSMGNVVEFGHAVLRGDRYDILMHVEA